MDWMRTVNHVTGRALVRGLVNLFNDMLERLAQNEAAFGFDRKQKDINIPICWAAFTIPIPWLTEFKVTAVTMFAPAIS
jgi:hypothetical protein